jgi:DNA invertase Pin-like site-specific DNA recombinase
VQNTPKGRSRKLTDEQITEARRLIRPGVPKSAVACGLGIDRTALHRMLAVPPLPAESRNHVVAL